MNIFLFNDRINCRIKSSIKDSNLIRKINTLSALLLFMVFLPRLSMATETPDYTVTKRAEVDGDTLELRTYAPMLVAETVVDASYANAGNKGFRILADYIFGNNTASTGDGSKISMTTPVTIKPNEKADNTSTNIDMTTPVTLTQSDGGEGGNETTNKWRVQFVMPSKYNMQTIPKPNSDKVRLREVPEKRYAVIRFSWLAGKDKIAKKTHTLTDWMQSQGLSPVGQAQVARYDPPWTPPFLRRNEVMLAY